MNWLGFILLLFNLTQLHEAGFRGEGMTIAVIDGGFFRAYDSTVFPQEQIIGAYDLVLGDSLAVDSLGMFEDPNNNHGTKVLSTMLYQDTTVGFVGTAPNAHYILIRSEDLGAEYYGEVERLARAFHLADSLDADIVTVSLGYFRFDDVEGQPNPRNFTYQDINGTSIASRAATELVRKGRFVCVSAGNAGDDDWHYIDVPSDADSILTVGAVDVDSAAASFSSYGPTADGRLKPEVSGLGLLTKVYCPEMQDTLGHYVGGMSLANGTSFSTPEIAGMVACLWQALPNLTNMELRQLIMESSSLYPLHEDQRGYGIPDAWFAYSGERLSLKELLNADERVQKRVENGQLMILKNGIKYTVLGLPVQKND